MGGKLSRVMVQALIALMPQLLMAGEHIVNQHDHLMGSKYSHSVAFSPDDQYFVVGYENKTLKLWELSSGKMMRVFRGHTDAVVSVAFSPNGKFILSGSMDHTMKLWDVSSGKEVRTFTGHTDAVLSVAFSTDGRYALSGSEDRNMKLWEVASGNEIRSFKGNDKGYIGAAVAFSPDEKTVLMGNTLWDRSTGKKIRTFKAIELRPYRKDSVKFSMDGKYVWIGETYLEVASGEAAAILTGTHGGGVFDHSIFAYSPDGNFVVAGGVS